MSDFFSKTDLSRKDAEGIISETLNKCDDGELYLENSKSESIMLDDNKIKHKLSDAFWSKSQKNLASIASKNSVLIKCYSN